MTEKEFIKILDDLWESLEANLFFNIHPNDEIIINYLFAQIKQIILEAEGRR